MLSEAKAGWPSVRLDHVSELCLGKMLDKEKNKGEPRPYLANMNVRWGSFDLQDLREMRFEEREFERYGLRFGDIVMCEGGEPGRCAIWMDEVPGMMIQKALHRIRPLEGIDGHYLYYALVHGAQSGSFDEYMTGSGIRHLPGNQVAKLEVLMPPLDEQRRIAEVLRSVDEAIESADLALTQARMVRQSAINELLSSTGGSAGLDRLHCRLSEVLSIAHGFPFKSEYFTSNRDDPTLLTPGNFSVEKTLYFGERTKHYSGPVPDGYVLEDGSLVVVMTDLTQDMAILGNAVEISGNGVVLHNQRIGRVSFLRPDLITKGYARLLLNSDLVQSRIKATASGSTVRHTAPSRILECEVQLPPLEEQAGIVAIAKSLDNVVVAEERRRSNDEVTGPLSHLRSLKDIIARDLLSGRVRVPA